ncbi:MAG: hypothetical protein OXI77_06180 [Chloroflexota bacterium]|nr:hypothetical protein [Chloroflexota bacterium]MDE2909797.1 hypothetical protein [Chloroflexota bacterium]
MFTRDIEIERLKAEYLSLRKAQDSILEGMNVTALTQIRMEESISRLEEDVSTIKAALDAILAHFEIPPKPQMGFRTDNDD